MIKKWFFPGGRLRGIGGWLVDSSILPHYVNILVDSIWSAQALIRAMLHNLLVHIIRFLLTFRIWPSALLLRHPLSRITEYVHLFRAVFALTRSIQS